MTTFTSARLAGPSALASGDSTVLTVPGSHTYVVRSILVANPSANPITVKIGVGGVADADLVMAPEIVPARDTLIFEPKMLPLAAADTLEANASASGTTITVSGVDET